MPAAMFYFRHIAADVYRRCLRLLLRWHDATTDDVFAPFFFSDDDAYSRDAEPRPGVSERRRRE